MKIDFHEKFDFVILTLTQCGNLAVSLPLKSLAKSILAGFRRSKTVILTFLEGFEF